MSINTYYHGTVSAFLPEIKKNGLRPEAQHTWRIHFDHSGELISPSEGMPILTGVYVTPDRHHAEAYAQTRADYFQRKPGECFSFFEFPENIKQGDYLFISKDEDAPVLHTHPILLTVQLDSDTLERDPNDTEFGLVHCTPVPLSAITHIEALQDKYDPRKYTKAYRKSVSDAAYTSIFGNDADLAKMLFGDLA